jgi:hypothetical protein
MVTGVIRVFELAGPSDDESLVGAVIQHQLWLKERVGLRAQELHLLEVFVVPWAV